MDEGKVWNVFERNLRGGRVCKFKVCIIGRDMWSSAVEFMLNNYIREEPWCVAAGTAGDDNAVEEFRVMLNNIVRHNFSTACFLTTSDGRGLTLVGVSIAIVQKKGVFIHYPEPTSKAGIKTVRILSEAMKLNCLFKVQSVEQCLFGAGLSVAPEYRGLGIAVELLKSRVALARQAGIDVTAGIFTSKASQRSADLAGFKTYFQIPYKDFGAKCKLVFLTNAEFLRMYSFII